MTRPKLHHVNLKTSRLFWAPKPTSIGTALHVPECLFSWQRGSPSAIHVCVLLEDGAVYLSNEAILKFRVGSSNEAFRYTPSPPRRKA
jgi:hypothetical protein